MWPALPEAVARSYEDHFHSRDPWKMVLRARPVFTVATSDELISRRELVRSKFYAECLRPNQVEDFRGALVPRTEAGSVVLGVLSSTRCGDAGRVRQGLSRLVRHLARALVLHERLAVVLPGPEAHAEADLSWLLREFYGPTEAESRLSWHLLRALGLKEIAADLGVSPATLRSQHLSVFRKTRTARQADLVLLLQRLAAVGLQSAPS